MNVYKLSVSDWDEKPLNKTVFEQETGKKSPWYVNNSEGASSNFAVCPGCDNPIQILGFYRQLANTNKPFARHHRYSIPNLAVYRQVAYDYCPYAAPRQYERAARRAGNDPLSNKILDILVPNFDRVIYILEQDIGIKISDRLAEELLVDYQGQGGAFYMGATLQNIPWIFAYMTRSKSLMGRMVTNDDVMLEVIKDRVPNVALNGKQLTWKGEKYVDLQFCFIDHRARHIDGKLQETMEIMVTLGRSNQQIYRKLIEFDRDRFRNLLRVSPDRAKRPRQEKLVSLAAKILGYCERE